MKILVVGSNGMAGHLITSYLKQKNYAVSTVAKNNATYNLNIEDATLTSKLFSEFKDDFDFVINCIGLLVKDSNDNPNRAILINSWFPHLLESTFKNLKTKVIHLSTDCVFDGSKGDYIETDFHTEKNFYGRSKSLGELNNDKDITFRMSIIGPEIKSNGTGLFNFIYNNINNEIQGWDNAWWNGITTLQLAECIDQYINNSTITGVYHLVDNDVKINKYELLSKINSIFNLNKKIVRTQGPKPVNKILINTRTDFQFNIENYDIQLNKLKEFMK